MKKIIIFSFSTILISLSFLSCKKGEHDPFLSLRSRTARLTGDWTVTNQVISTSEMFEDSTISINGIYNGKNKISTTVIQNKDTTITIIDTVFYSYKISFKKDGTYSQTIKYNNNINLKTVEGTWVFLGKSDINNLKNKEAILLTTTKTIVFNGSSTDVFNYTNLNGKTLVLDELKNDEIISIEDTDYKNETKLNSGKSSIKTTYTLN